MYGLEQMHPAVAALYFASVTLITMFSAEPLFSLLALPGAVMYFALVKGRISFKSTGFYILMFVLIAITNPLFSHKGVTVLFFLNNNPVTLESVLYGVNTALMLVAVVCWFGCFNLVMTSDKLLFLFGRLSPKIALLISSALRFIPLFKSRSAKIRRAQTAMGLFSSDTWTDKLKANACVYSALITWALENAIDTGASMKARGYGLKGRSSYSLFKFRRSDALALAFILLSDAVILTASAGGQLGFSFYPEITVAPLTVCSMAAVCAFAGLSFLPFIVEVKEGLLWKYYRSKI